MSVVVTNILTSCTGGEDQEKSNPLLNDFNTPFNVPPFDKIKVAHFMPAFQSSLTDARNELKAITENKEEPTFENTIVALDNMGEKFKRTAAVFLELTSSNTGDSLQAVEVEVAPILAGFRDEVNLNPELFGRIKSVYENQEKFNLNEEQKFILENLYKGFVRNGANLSGADQDTLRELNKNISLLCVKFNQNVLAENNLHKIIVNDDLTDGLPEDLVKTAKEAAKAQGLEGKSVFSVQRTVVFPFLQYSPHRELRKELFEAYYMRGNVGNENDNNQIFSDIVRLRAQRAKLLGYKSHAHIVLEPRMAKVPENVFALLDNLWEKAIPVAKNEVAEMQKIIDAEKGGFKLEPSDWWYYSEKLRKQKFDLDDNELKPFFELENVKSGLFEVVNRLFGITLTSLQDIPLPHPDAIAYEVKEADGSHLGILYMDFYTRESKRQGAWCTTYQSHHVKDNASVPPVASLVCNFSEPSENDACLLTLDEVSTLYHEFGHALDFLMNKSTYNTTYQAWDFVELPSQLMEHWVTEPEVLKLFAKHYKTGESISDELISKINKSGTFNQGFANVEVLAASLLDMAFYTIEHPAQVDVQKFEKEYMDKIGLISEIIPRYRTTYFSHITSEYDAGYYSYTWAAILDNDAFEAFKEKGIFNAETATSYRKNILERNGSVDAMKMYIDFRGREPVIEPMLKNRGLL